MTPNRGLLVAGTSSDAGKSLIVAGLCRSLSRKGMRVAPFKAQNMSNNSMVCADGSEIGRAQWLQAVAARAEPESAMNPVLLKPGTDRRSHIVLRGRPFGTLESGQYATGRRALAEAAFSAYADLSSRFDVVVSEGAGSPAEVNLRAGDYVNMGLARRFELPVVVVGDIDRGGTLASLYGTWALLDEDDRRLFRAYVINKFRGDAAVLAPGLDEITRRTGVPCLGVVPWLDDVWLDGEDALAIGGWHHRPNDPGAATLTVAVVRFPRVSNATDVDALAAEPGVEVVVTADPTTCATADVLVFPGSRATVSDLAWLRARGIDRVVEHRAHTGRATLGICGGYQMLARTIDDDVESGAGSVAGLGILPARVDFDGEKVLALPSGSWRGESVMGYAIHHGRVTVEARGPEDLGESGDAPFEPFLDGCRVGSTWGTLWHGAFEVDGFRRAWLTAVAEAQGLAWRPVSGAPGFAERREAMIDRVADALEEHVDIDGLVAL
ncbi:cobyric acid synthase [Mariniluteicoccus flavus]